MMFTVAIFRDVHPFAVPNTVKCAVDGILTEITEVVAPLLQLYVEAPLAVTWPGSNRQSVGEETFSDG